MKISVTSYSFQRLLVSGALKLTDLPAVSRDIGFEGIEIASVPFDRDADFAGWAKDVKKAAADAGIPVIAYLTGADFLNHPGGVEGQINDLKKELQTAEALGVNLMRHDASRGFPKEKKTCRSFDDALPMLAEGYGRVTEYAKTLGIKTCIENHGFFSQDSERVEKLINAVGNDNFGALVDMGNFLCADERPDTAVGRLAPYAVHCHAKDFLYKSGEETDPGRGWFKTRGGNYLRGTIVGHGVVPVRQCISLMKAAGYDGWVTIEFEGMEDNIEALETGLENLKKII